MRTHPGVGDSQGRRRIGERQRRKEMVAKGGKGRWLQLSRGGCMLPALGTRKRSGGVLGDRVRVGAARGESGESRAEKPASILT